MSGQSDDATKRRFEVGVEGMGGDYEHVNVQARTPERAFKKAEKSYPLNLTEPVNAYQAYEIGEGVTHER